MSSVRRFYDELAPDYHRVFADWDRSMAAQASALDALLTGALGAGPHRLLDAACGIGTQAIGLAARGHRVVGTDLSPRAAARATREAAARAVSLPTAAADLRALPLRAGAFDAAVCADNSLPHLLAPGEVHTALTGLHRVLREQGLLLLTVRDYDEVRRTRPAAPAPQVSTDAEGRETVTLQLWRRHEDGERYDLRHIQLTGQDDDWQVRERRTTYWALTREQLTAHVRDAGFAEVTWHEPASTGFYQPVLTARRPAGQPSARAATARAQR
ncbi:class I SAM-dependent methyltransferase [Streptomyces sp. NPDC049813]|uniref:class I SAM-dependent methyltransferase n=1 Tax=Streptomyces sp. NPDC049813 TaxID=3365597 RepID=UPI0037B87430